MSFPTNCIRGIPNEDFIVKEDGTVGSHLFHFSGCAREDGCSAPIKLDTKKAFLSEYSPA